MHERVEKELLEIFEYAAEITDWIILKKILIRSLPSDLRAEFAKHNKWKEPFAVPNDFEREIMAKWKELGGLELLVREHGKNTNQWAAEQAQKWRERSPKHRAKALAASKLNPAPA